MTKPKAKLMGKKHWSASGFDRVEMGDGWWVPPRVLLDFTGDKGAPDIHGVFEIRAERPECVELTFRAKPDGRGLESMDFADIRIDNLVVQAFAMFGAKLDADGNGVVFEAGEVTEEDAQRWLEATGPALERRQSRRPAAPSTIQSVATVYKTDATGAPIKAVQTYLGCSRSTAHRRVKDARDAGLLPPVTKE